MVGNQGKNQPQSDFNLTDIVKTVESHASNFADLSLRVKNLEEKLGSNEKIADTLCEASEKAVRMREMFETTFVDMLKKNDKARGEIEELIKGVDRDFVQAKLKQYGTWLAAGILFILAQVSIEVVKFLFKLLGSHVGTPSL